LLDLLLLCCGWISFKRFHPGHAVMAPLICWSFSNSMFRYLLVDHAVPAMWRSAQNDCVFQHNPTFYKNTGSALDLSQTRCFDGSSKTHTMNFV
jgi:hypothetical protein